MPPIAVWAGEVVLLIDARPGDALTLACALHARGRGRVRVARVVSFASPDRCATALAAAASDAAAVVCVVRAASRAGAAVEALRRAVARRVPCRCVCLPPAPALAGPRDC